MHFNANDSILVNIVASLAVIAAGTPACPPAGWARNTPKRSLFSFGQFARGSSPSTFDSFLIHF